MDHRVVVLALLVSLAGCGGGVGGDAGARTVNPALADTPTVSPTPTPEPDYPPGVTADGVDVGELTTAHDRGLARRNSTVRFERSVVAANGTTLSVRRSVTESARERLGFRIEVNGSLPGEAGPPLSTFAFWTNGSVTAIRSVAENGSPTYQVVPGRPPTVTAVDDSGEGVLFAAFAETAPRLAETKTVDGEQRYVIRAERDRLNRTGRPPVRNFSAVAVVTQDGVVRSYEVRYTRTYETPAGPVTATTTERFRVTVGETTAAPPPWVAAALRAEDDT